MGDFEEVWGPDEERESKLVFIGKNLDEDALRSGFEKCIMSPELEEQKKKQLRFAVATASTAKSHSAPGVKPGSQQERSLAGSKAR